MKVFWALMMMTGSSGRLRRNLGRYSNASPSGIITSVTTRSPSPAETQRHSVARLEVTLTSKPARLSAWLTTVRMAASSSAMKASPLLMRFLR